MSLGWKLCLMVTIMVTLMGCTEKPTVPEPVQGSFCVCPRVEQPTCHAYEKSAIETYNPEDCDTVCTRPICEKKSFDVNESYIAYCEEDADCVPITDNCCTPPQCIFKTINAAYVTEWTAHMDAWCAERSRSICVDIRPCSLNHARVPRCAGNTCVVIDENRTQVAFSAGGVPLSGVRHVKIIVTSYESRTSLEADGVVFLSGRYPEWTVSIPFARLPELARNSNIVLMRDITGYEKTEESLYGRIDGSTGEINITVACYEDVSLENCQSVAGKYGIIDPNRGNTNRPVIVVQVEGSSVRSLAGEDYIEYVEFADKIAIPTQNS